MKNRLQRCALVVMATLVLALTFAASSALADHGPYDPSDPYGPNYDPGRAGWGMYGELVTFNPGYAGRWARAADYSCYDLAMSCYKTEPIVNVMPAQWYDQRAGTWRNVGIARGTDLYLYQAYSGYWMVWHQHYGFYYIRWDYLNYF